MKVKTEGIKSWRKKTAMLCGFVIEGSDKILGFDQIDLKINSGIKQSIKDMGGKFSEISVISITEKLTIQRILLAGLGKKERFDYDTLRIVSGKIIQKAMELKIKELSIVIPQSLLDEQFFSVSQIVEGCTISSYKFVKYKTKKENNIPDLTILVSRPEKILKTIKIAEIISDSVTYTKSIANLPPNECTPKTLANFATTLSKKNKMKLKIISKDELRRKGFGGITAVGQGSKNESKLIIFEYNRGHRTEKPIVLVGKGVTFDTGGISLKPGEKMDEMKFDKCGGCVVFGIMKAVSELKLPINLVGIVPAVENMPSGESFRPGDIIKLYNGKTAEILNTDAEGRLILADALSFGEQQYSPKIIIDFATLTGACIIALGTNVAGMVSNDHKLSQKIMESSRRTAEDVWRLPLNEDFMNLIKSDVADMKNTGVGRVAGAITAAAFLRNAIGETPWVHFDIAGVAWTQVATKDKPYNSKGATGFGVRLILDYLQNTEFVKYR